MIMHKRNKKIIAIIPARGGSKRLPKKNLLPLLGKPLIEHSIDFAKHNKDSIDEIVVSTDDEEIKNFALEKDITVIDRPKAISGDTATTVSALKHVLQTIDKEYDYVILLQPTNPCRPDNLLKAALNEFFESGCDSLMTVSKSDKKLGKIADGTFKPYNYNPGQRSQDLEPLYYENGLLYIIKASYILEDVILAENNYSFVVNHPFSKVDIDYQEDFDFAEFVLNNYTND